MVSVQSFNEQPKHFTIFDAVGEMASGMAYVHVAIPLNLTTFTIQANVLEEYLFKLTWVVDNKMEKVTFLQSFREIAKFGQTRLIRLRNMVIHLDQILSFDRYITIQRQRQTNINTLDVDEVINHKCFLENKIIDLIKLEVIYKDIKRL